MIKHNRTLSLIGRIALANKMLANAEARLANFDAWYAERESREELYEGQHLSISREEFFSSASNRASKAKAQLANAIARLEKAQPKPTCRWCHERKRWHEVQVAA